MKALGAAATGVVGTAEVGAASVVVVASAMSALVETVVLVRGMGELWGTGIGGIGGRLSG